VVGFEALMLAGEDLQMVVETRFHQHHRQDLDEFEVRPSYWAVVVVVVPRLQQLVEDQVVALD